MNKSNSFGLRHALRRLTDPHLISWPFFFLSLAAWLLSFYPQVFRSSDPFTGDWVFGWVVSILAGQTVLFAFLLIARSVWLRTAWASAHPAVVVWTFTIGTLLGVVTANVVAQQLPAGKQGLLFAVEHLIFGVLGLCIIGSIYIAFRSYRADVSELETKQGELQALLAAGEHTLQADSASVQETVTQVMTDAMGALHRDDPGVVDFLSASSDQLLRTLSHSLASDTSGVPTVIVESPRPRWRQIIAEATSKPLITPLLTSMILVLFAWRISFSEGAVAPPQATFNAAGNTIGVSVDLVSFTQSLLELMSVFLGTYVAAWLVMKLTAAPLRRSHPRVRLVIIGIGAVAIAVISQVIIAGLFSVLNLEPMIERDLLPRALMVILIAGVILVMGIVRATDLAQRDIKGQLRETNRALTWQVARTNEEIWNQRRTLALVVHGPVRAALISSAMEIAKAQDPNNPVLIGTLTERIARAGTDFFDPPTHTDPLAPLHQLQQLWAGTCTIDIDVDQHTCQQMTADPITAQVAIKVIEEACANAIIHGNATTISIGAHANGEELEITVANDGTPPQLEDKRGLGLRFIDEVSLHWRFASSATEIRLRVLLPIRPVS